MSPLLRPTAVLKLPTRVPALINFARAIVQSIATSSHLPHPRPTLATLTTAIDDLENAEVDARSRTKGTIEVRDQKREALVTLLDHVRSYVQKVADGDPNDAPSIIESAAMAVHRPITHGKRVFAATRGRVTGSVNVGASPVADRATYHWQYSADGGTTWVTAPATLRAKTQLSGLEPGRNYLFRYRSVVKTGVSDWSEPVSLMVT